MGQPGKKMGLFNPNQFLPLACCEAIRAGTRAVEVGNKVGMVGMRGEEQPEMETLNRCLFFNWLARGEVNLSLSVFGPDCFPPLNGGCHRRDRSCLSMGAGR